MRIPVITIESPASHIVGVQPMTSLAGIVSTAVNVQKFQWRSFGTVNNSFVVVQCNHEVQDWLAEEHQIKRSRYELCCYVPVDIFTILMLRWPSSKPMSWT